MTAWKIDGSWVSDVIIEMLNQHQQPLTFSPLVEDKQSPTCLYCCRPGFGYLQVMDTLITWQVRTRSQGRPPRELLSKLSYVSMNRCNPVAERRFSKQERRVRKGESGDDTCRESQKFSSPEAWSGGLEKAEAWAIGKGQPVKMIVSPPEEVGL